MEKELRDLHSMTCASMEDKDGPFYNELCACDAGKLASKCADWIEEAAAALAEQEGMKMVPRTSIMPFAAVLRDKLRNNPWPTSDPVWATLEIWAEELCRLAAPAAAGPVHTDHPLRHWDRTCPACLKEYADEHPAPPAVKGGA